jgi:hypothetical protein
MRAVRGGLRAAILLMLTVGVATAFFSCGDKKSPTGPSSTDLTVIAISPGSGTTLGGTAITITGTHFAAGATVMIGGAAATSITLVSDTSITAMTPQHATGASDVIVSAGGKTGTLRSGFTFAAPATQANQPPAIANISIKGTGRNEPGGYSDIDETLNIVASVSDAETPVSDLKFAWSVEVGTINGDGPTVTWRSPHDVPSPRDVTFTLTVTERFQSTDDNGLPVTKENKTTGTAVVSLHDSRKEVGDMAYQFMADFSNSGVPKSTVMQNFSNSCTETGKEGSDVDKNRKLWHIDSYDDGKASVDLKFAGSCKVDVGAVDACAYLPWTWRSTCVNPGPRQGQKATAKGQDQVSAIYQGNRWWLCGSRWIGESGSGPTDNDCNGSPTATSTETTLGMRVR